jgi:hypothetical protein
MVRQIKEREEDRYLVSSRLQTVIAPLERLGLVELQAGVHESPSSRSYGAKKLHSREALLSQGAHPENNPQPAFPGAIPHRTSGQQIRHVGIQSTQPFS